MLISTGGTVIKMPVEDVKRLGRSTQGVIVMRLRERRDGLRARAGRRAPTTGAAATSSGDEPPVRRRRGRLEPVEEDRATRTSCRRRRALGRVATAPHTPGRGLQTAVGGEREDRAMALRQRAEVELEPVDIAAHLDRVELYLGQVCRLAGISKMQLDYWTNKAQIPTSGKKQRHLRPRRDRDRDADQAGARQGPEPRRRDRGRAAASATAVA